MDQYARMYLWQVGKDYGHGTGHGVGYFLNVHEGPCGISRGNTEPLQEGMCLSDEPGYYEEGNFGIRIENVVIVERHESNDNMLKWYNMTMAPYCRKLLKMDLLTSVEIAHIDRYHQEVFDRLKD